MISTLVHSCQTLRLRNVWKCQSRSLVISRQIITHCTHTHWLLTVRRSQPFVDFSASLSASVSYSGKKTAGSLTLLWPSIACSSRSLITCGAAVAAVIARWSRGSGWIQTADNPRRRGGGFTKSDFQRPEENSSLSQSIMVMKLLCSR